MKPKFSIKCRFAPVGRFGPLIPNLDLEDAHFMLQIPQLLQSPKGLDAGGLVFDMQDDGGVDSIEIFGPLGPGLVDRTIAPDPQEEYWRLFLELDDKNLVEKHAKLEFERTGHLALCRISPGTVHKHYLIGPGVNALVANDELLGISLDLTGLMK